MAVPAGLTDELWHWLLESGWREITYRPDRRLYRDIPSSLVHALIDAPSEFRQRVLEEAQTRAAVRPSVHRPGGMASYIDLE